MAQLNPAAGEVKAGAPEAGEFGGTVDPAVNGDLPRAVGVAASGGGEEEDLEGGWHEKSSEGKS